MRVSLNFEIRVWEFWGLIAFSEKASRHLVEEVMNSLLMLIKKGDESSFDEEVIEKVLK